METSFNPETHEYFRDGKRVYSVTQIMQAVTEPYFAHINRDVLNKKAELGNYVHALCEHYDLGDLGDESEIHPMALPYFQAYKQFLLDTNFHVVYNERQLFHPRLDYAGTIDRTGYLNGKMVLIDIKTIATMAKHTGIQLAGYQELLIAQKEPVIVSSSIALQLKPNGTYKLHAYDDPIHTKDFFTLLDFHQLKTRYL